MKLRRPSPSGIIAVLALFAAIGSTAVAAGRYVITSTNQIEPSVLKQLRQEVDAQMAKAATKGAKAVVARVHSVGAIEASPAPLSAPDPLTGATWTQGPDELNEFVAGYVTLTRPSVVECPYDAVGITVTVDLDGLRTLTASTGIGGVSEGTSSLALRWEPTEAFPPFESERWLPEPTKATSHIVTAQAEDYCTDSQAEQPTTPVTIDSVSIDVIGVR
jgi:hypothetical protein